MPPVNSCRVLAVALAAGMLVNCSPADNPYARIQDPPLVRARLHTVTVVTPDAGLSQRLDEAGYHGTALPESNYPAAAPIEAALWNLPQELAANNAIFMPPPGQGPAVRVVFLRKPSPLQPPDVELVTAFFRNVLGSEVPTWQGSTTLGNGARVQAWTFAVDDLLAAKQRLKEGGIAIAVEPVAITTAYLGHHQAMAIQAPDGTMVELVQIVVSQ